MLLLLVNLDVLLYFGKELYNEASCCNVSYIVSFRGGVFFKEKQFVNHFVVVVVVDQWQHLVVF